MPDARTQYQQELLTAITQALPGVRVEALAGESQLQSNAQQWPAVYVVLSSIEWDTAAVIAAPERQPSLWTWTVLCHGRTTATPPEMTAYDLAETVVSTLAGMRLSDPRTGPLQVRAEELLSLLYASQIRAITVQHHRRPA